MFKGLKKTEFRIKLIDIFNQYDYAISNKTIEENLGDFDRITLYRTLKTFNEKGIIHVVEQEGQETFYAMCKDECDQHQHNHQHVHFTCTECGHHFCIEDIDPMELPISLKDYQIEEIALTIKGVCKNCFPA